MGTAPQKKRGEKFRGHYFYSLGVGDDEDVGRARRERATGADAGLTMHQVVAVPHQLQRRHVPYRRLGLISCHGARKSEVFKNSQEGGLPGF